MGPHAVCKRASEAGLTHIALTDHNSTRNCKAFISVANEYNLVCFPGIEVTSSEEAHILCYLPSLESAVKFGDLVESTLPAVISPDSDDQIIVNEMEEIEGFCESYLALACSLSVSDIVCEVHALGGFVVPAHIDKPLFSIISQLGFLPDDSFDALEISSHGVGKFPLERYGCAKYPLLSSSDSHYLESVGGVSVEIESDTFPLKVDQIFDLFWRSSNLNISYHK